MKSGDKVICIDDESSNNWLKNGQIYEIRGVEERINGEVKFVYLKGMGSFWWPSRFKKAGSINCRKIVIRGGK